MRFMILSPATQKIASVALAFGALSTIFGYLQCHVPKPLTKHPGCDLRPARRSESENSILSRDPARAAPDCSTATCGSNSPYINSFPINGLNYSGCINADGYAFDTTSLRVHDRACSIMGTATLEFQPVGAYLGDPPLKGWELVARGIDAYGKEQLCTGRELTGATFEVGSTHGTVKLLISHVGMTSLTYVLPSDIVDVHNCKRSCDEQYPIIITPWFPWFTDPHKKERETCRQRCEIIRPKERRLVYLIAHDDNPSDSLCTHRRWFEDELKDDAGASHHSEHYPHIQSFPHIYDQYWDIAHEELGDYAIILPGAIYSKRGDSIGLRHEPAATDNVHWFNIACAGDGLAQSDLGGIVVPSTEPFTSCPEHCNNSSCCKAQDDPMRQAAIHMFSAQYARGKIGTVGGMPIAWNTCGSGSERLSIDFLSDNPPKLDSCAGSAPQPPPGEDSPTEAEWDEFGAVAVYHSRLWMKNRVIPLPPDIKLTATPPAPEQSENRFVKSACESRSGPKDARRKAKLISYVRGHISHVPHGSEPYEPEPSPCYSPAPSSVQARP